jgi:hypothetical protein
LVALSAIEGLLLARRHKVDAGIPVDLDRTAYDVRAGR